MQTNNTWPKTETERQIEGHGKQQNNRKSQTRIHTDKRTYTEYYRRRWKDTEEPRDKDTKTPRQRQGNTDRHGYIDKYIDMQRRAITHKHTYTRRYPVGIRQHAAGHKEMYHGCRDRWNVIRRQDEREMNRSENVALSRTQMYIHVSYLCMHMHTENNMHKLRYIIHCVREKRFPHGDIKETSRYSSIFKIPKSF